MTIMATAFVCLLICLAVRRLVEFRTQFEEETLFDRDMQNLVY